MLTIFDVLTSEDHYSDNINARIQSIKNHLFELLNTRQGSIAHLPDYGLPDLCQLYQQLPSSALILCTEIKTLIDKYEPRLENVMVTWLGQNIDAVVSLEIHALLPNGFLAQFVTDFRSNYMAEVFV